MNTRIMAGWPLFAYPNSAIPRKPLDGKPVTPNRGEEERMSRLRHNFQTIAWFRDLFNRGQLDLDPAYQRRSVWNQDYKDYFIDSVLLCYPTAAIFLYEELSAEGTVVYRVIDGKQRLSTILEFIDDQFPVYERAQTTSLRGLYFSQLDDAAKKAFWGYEFLVEYAPTVEESAINSIFDRINRNVAKLTRQELRHARYDGVFISVAEDLSEWMIATLPPGFPNIASRSRKQMKDVELVAYLLLFLEEGAKSYSQDDLDKAFSDRDAEWDARQACEERFRVTIKTIDDILAAPSGAELPKSRLRNQADFYSLFGAVSELVPDDISPEDAAVRLSEFVARVDDETARQNDTIAAEYYEAARSASNDAGPRAKRIRIIREVVVGSNAGTSS